MIERRPITEVLWILGIFWISVALLWMFFGNALFIDPDAEVFFYNTSFPIDLWFLLLSSFLILLSFTYAIKEGLKRYNRFTGNAILSLSLTGNILTLSFAIKVLSAFQTYYNHAIYPAFGNSSDSDDPFTFWINILPVVQFFLLIALLLLGIKTGARIKKRSGPTPGWRD